MINRRLLGAAAAAVVALAGWAAGAAPAHAGTPATLTVTLGFDDGWASAAAAGPILAQAGLPGVFYVNSGMINQPGRLTLDQVRELERAGNEIGGHTVDHPNLALLDSGTQRYEICDDRFQLIEWGLDVRSFAYPHGSLTADTPGLVKACGYARARLVGPGSASHPVFTTAATDPYATTAVSDDGTTSPAQLIGAVQAGEKAVQDGTARSVELTFHKVCDAVNGVCEADHTPIPATPQTDYRITPADLQQVVSWLAGEQAAGRLVVRRPRDSTPSTAPPVLSPGPPLAVANGDLETSPTTAICWVAEAYQSGTGHLDVVPGRTGEGLRLTVDTAPSDGTGGMRASLNRSDCPVPITPTTPGDGLGASIAYSGAGIRLYVLYQNPVTRSWLTAVASARQPDTAPGQWRTVSVALPALPAGTHVLSASVQLLGPAGASTVVDDAAFSRLRSAPAPELAVPAKAYAYGTAGRLRLPLADPPGVPGGHVDLLDAAGNPIRSFRLPATGIDADVDLPGPVLPLRSVGPDGSVRPYSIAVFDAGAMRWTVDGNRPVCLDLGGWGTSTYAYQHLREGDVRFERVLVQDRTSGARSIVTSQHNPACQPVTAPGATTAVGLRYRLAGRGVLVAYARVGDSWTLFDHRELAPSATWAPAAWMTGPAPSGASAVSVGLQLQSAGSADLTGLTVAGG